MKSSEKNNPYSNTVLLPETNFPMKADLKDREPKQISKWKSEKIYFQMLEKMKGKEKFILHDGPPYANGNLHLGHSLNKILKDIIIKSKHFSGFYSEIIPGWDCHGLPIEVQVLKNLGKDAKSISSSELRKKCRDYANEYVKKQGDDLTRFLCFWDEEKKYLTMSKDYESKILQVFASLFKSGYVYKGKKPVYWDITLATAHAEAEIEYANHTSPSIYVKFPIQSVSDSYCLIWTTTPWTLPANLAISFGKEISYSFYSINSTDKILIADLLKESVEKACGITLKKEKSVSVLEIEKMKFHHPFLEKISIPVFGPHVTTDAGTGCVHTAPGHGMDDYKVGLAYGLEPFSPVDDYGRYTEEYPDMKGVNIFQANPRIIEILKEKSLLLHYSEFEHSYPHSWRSKKPLIFRATPQWFFSIDYNDLRKKSLDFIQKVKWVPDWGITRIQSMVETRPDWCLSRQRNWGVPIPSFTCASCGEVHITDESIQYFVNIVKKEGIEVWYEREAKELLPENSSCAKCGGKKFTKDGDILDVWFDSGVSNFAVLEEPVPGIPPADLYLEGTDQHRGWFQSSLWPSVALRNIPPYKSVLTHGYVLDEKGHAMSKSLGNVVNPKTDVIDKFGADVLRLWVASQDFRDDVRFGNESIKIVAEQYRKLRNTFRYLLGNLSGHKKEDNLSTDQMDEIDLYYLALLANLSEEIKKSYNNYQFHIIYQKVIKFCTVELSQEYFEIIRDRMYCDKKDSMTRRSSATALSIILETLSIYLAPILSFTSEEVWEHYGKKESIFLSEFPDLSFYKNDELTKKFEPVFTAKESIQKVLELARNQGKLGKSLEAKAWISGNIAKELFHNFSKEKLEMYFVVSQLEEGNSKSPVSNFETKDFSVEITIPESPECPRCWRHTPEISKEGDLCSRCSNSIR